MNETLQNQNLMQNQNPMLNQATAPYGVAALILGVFSLMTGCLFIGLILGIIGLVLANKGNRIVSMDLSAYKGIGMLRAGKVLSILGIVFGAISLVAGLIGLAVGGSLFFIEDILDWIDIF